MFPPPCILKNYSSPFCQVSDVYPEPFEYIYHIWCQKWDRFDRSQEAANDNLKAAQQRQKTWYDRNARKRSFQIGDNVLVLLPSSTSKLLAEWQGPYPVTKQLGPITYEVDMFDKRRKKRVFHVNMLRAWHSADNSHLVAFSIPAVTDAEDLEYNGDSSKRGQLTEEQHADLNALLTEFSDVFSDTPGRTTLAEHEINTGNTAPVRQAPHRIPHAYRDMVREEVDRLLEEDIIELSSSPWASPVVLVFKKDKSLRLCVDYRRLNDASDMNAYPLPRVYDIDIIDMLGAAKFITTLDLTKGYWQVPVAPTSRPKTAFINPFGLYQFRTMPFGLKGAPATFQRLMDTLLRDFQDFADAYLDDLVIFSRTWKEHLAHLRAILERIRPAGLTIRLKKC